MTAPLHYDIETFSEEDLKAAGVYRYAEHPSTEMLCMSYRFGDGPVTLWIPSEETPALRTIVEQVRTALAQKSPLHAQTRIILSKSVPAEIVEHINAAR